MKACSFIFYAGFFLLFLAFSLDGAKPQGKPNHGGKPQDKPKVKLGKVMQNGKARIAQIPSDSEKGAKGLLGKPKSANSDEIEDDDTASMEPGSCLEINENGNEIGIEDVTSSGKKQHKKDFMNAQFKKGSPITEPRRNGRPKFTKQILTHAFEGTNVTFEWLLADEEGNITQEDETDELKAGSLKLTMTLKGWEFCGRDKECVRNSTGFRERGAGIKCSFKIKPRKGRSTLARMQRGSSNKGLGRPDRFDIGSNGTVTFSFKVKIDNNWFTLNDTDITLSGTTVYVRFPMFNDTLEYDPTIEMGDDIGDIGDNTGSSAIKMIPSLVIIILLTTLYVP